MRALECFPDAIVRVGALPLRTAHAFSSDALMHAFGAYESARAAAIRAAAIASEGLFHEVASIDDAQVRGSILRVRRRLYKGSPPPARDLERCVGAISASARGTVEAATTALDRATGLRSEIARLVAAEAPRLRLNLREIATSGEVGCGIALSAPSLFKNLCRIPPETIERPTARQLQVDRGALRYVTRAVMKATPFSTFCVVGGGRFQAAEGTTVRSDRTCLVRLNKLLFPHLWEGLRFRPDVRRRLIVELNPTLLESTDAYAFVALVRGAESFQRLSSHETISTVVESVGRCGRSFGSLVDELSRAGTVDATEDEVVGFVNGLAEVGLIRLQSPVLAQDDQWHVSLAAWLRGSDEPHCVAVRDLLDVAAEIISAYASASARARAQLLDDLRTAVDRATDDLAVPRVRPSMLLIYEDYGTSATVPMGHHRSFAETIATLGRFLESRLAIAAPRLEMASMRHFMDSRFAGRSAVPLLQFFEEYYRSHLRDHLAKDERIRRGEVADDLRNHDSLNPFDLAIGRAIREYEQSCLRTIARRWAAEPAAEEIDLRWEEWPMPPAAIASTGSAPRSLAAFVQPVFPVDGRPVRLIVPNGQTFLGFGKFHSRFLPLLASEITDRVFERNRRTDSAKLAEIAGDAHYNANFHPPIVPCTIDYPTGDNDQRGAGIPATSLLVDRDPEDEFALRLTDTSDGRRVIPLDMGFLNPVRRPALYRLLAAFSAAGQSFVRLPDQPAHVSSESPAALVRMRPRIVLGGRIVIARRRWSVSDQLFPARRVGEELAEYCLRLREWRAEHGIPERVFVRIFPRLLHGLAAREESPPEMSAEGVAAESAEEADEHSADVPEVEPGALPAGDERRPAARPDLKRDLQKPQFIDFANPLLSDLFGRLVVNLTAFVAQLEEQYPTPEESFELGGEKVASEFILQFDEPLTTDAD